MIKVSRRDGDLMLGWNFGESVHWATIGIRVDFGMELKEGMHHVSDCSISEQNCSQKYRIGSIGGKNVSLYG